VGKKAVLLQSSKETKSALTPDTPGDWFSFCDGLCGVSSIAAGFSSLLWRNPRHLLFPL
jgi:hypothetical protein